MTIRGAPQPECGPEGGDWAQSWRDPMPILAGRRLRPYEILSPCSSGHIKLPCDAIGILEGHIMFTERFVQFHPRVVHPRLR